MKKKIVILLGVVFALVLSFALTACGKVALKLTFKVDGEVYQTISTSGNEVISMPENPTKDGFIFDGWFWDEGTWQKPFTANSLLDTPLSSDMSVYAKFSVDATPIGTEIKAEGFEKNDSVYYTKVSNATETFSFIGKIRVADGAIWRVFTDVACTAEVPSRTKEVSVGDNKFYILVTNGNDVNSYPFVVRRRPIYTVTYRTNNGSYITSQRVEEDSYATDFTPTCAGYTFKAWNYDFTQPIVEDTTITASLDTITYNISYDLTGGEFEGEYVKTYTVETPTFALATPVKHGYTFLGWYDGETKVEKITRWSIGDRSFAAKWEINVYRITYTVKYGTNNANNVLTYTVNDEVKFFDPYYINGDFIKWQDRNGNKITKIEKGSIGNVSIAAVYDLYDVKLLLDNDDTFTVVGKQTEGNTVNIKSEYKGKKVTSIGDYAFEYCGSLTSITIPNSVTSIGDYAFSGCSGLKSVAIPDSVTNIGDYVFYNCSSLTSVTIHNSITSIGDYAFSGCSSLTSITIPDSVTSIGSSAFDGCPIEIATLPTLAISRIPKTKLKTVIITSGNSIDDSAFSNCSSLTSITISDSLTSIGSNAFDGCPIETATIPTTAISSIPKTKLKTVIITTGESIGREAFRNCSSLTSITIGNSVTSIGNYAFSGCSSLTNITIPNSVMSIGIYVFDNCRSLTNVKISDGVMSIGWGMFYNCSSLTSITIPNSVTSIEYQAFSGCSSLTSITIPNSVENVGSSAFSGCSNLKTIYCEAESKPSGWDGGWQYTCYANVVWGYKG